MTRRGLIPLFTCLLLNTSACSPPAASSPSSADGGMGPSMMAGYGPASWGPNICDLTDEQRSKIVQIRKELRHKQRALTEAIQADSRPGKFDALAARKQNDAVANLYKQMFEHFVEAQKRIDSILTSEQRERLQRQWDGRYAVPWNCWR